MKKGMFKNKKSKNKKSKKKLDKKPIFVLSRYIILLVLMLSLSLIYKILTPLTLYSTAGLLKLFYQASINKNIIFIVPKTIIQIIPSCVAGSAYLLLMILNISVPMKLKQRVYSIFFSIILLFIVNILRIFFLTILLINDFRFFDITHKLFWYVLSTIFVVGIWFLTAYLFKIKQIPIYTDIKYLTENIKRGKK